MCSIWGELYGYDVRWGPEAPSPLGTCIVDVNQEWKNDLSDWPRTSDESCVDPIKCYRGGVLSEDCEGNTVSWQFWYTLVLGLGLWLASNLGYLRSMAQIHIFHRVPLAFLVKLGVMLLPWAVASVVGSPFLALGLGIAYLFYTSMLFAELWPMRDDFLDVKHHAWGCIAAIVNVMGQIWIVQGGRVGRRIDWDLDWDFKAVVPPEVAAANAFITVLIVAVHFCFTAGHLLYLAVFKANDPSVLGEYYDEYNPDNKEHFKAQMHTFDHQVRTHARTLDDHSLHGRVARRRGKGDRSVMEEGQEQRRTRMKHHCGWKSCLLFPFTCGLVYICPADKREVHKHDGSPTNPKWHHKVRKATKDTYHHVAHNTAIGHHVHKHAYHRGQFGTRKRLKPQTLQRMGRNESERKPASQPASQPADPSRCASSSLAFFYASDFRLTLLSVCLQTGTVTQPLPGKTCQQAVIGQQKMVSAMIKGGRVPPLRAHSHRSRARRSSRQALPTLFCCQALLKQKMTTTITIITTIRTEKRGITTITTMIRRRVELL